MWDAVKVHLPSAWLGWRRQKPEQHGGLLFSVQAVPVGKHCAAAIIGPVDIHACTSSILLYENTSFFFKEGGLEIGMESVDHKFIRV